MSSPTNISEGVSRSGLPAFRLIESHLSRAKKLIDEQMTGPAEAGDINRLLEYLRCRSSEMIRPGLVLLAGKCCGKITEEHILVAAIVEIIHNATLLHDDVIGKGQKQLDRPSVNGFCSNETAVLLGDFLLGRIFQMCAGLKPQVNEIIAGAAVRICEGQLRQIAQRQNWRLSEPEYIDVITEKSAVLFSIACRLGALLAQGTDDQIRLLAESGLNAGIAYQITDELLGVIGGENETQASIGTGIYEHGPNLAAIHLLGLVDEKDREAIISSCSGQKGLQHDKDALAKMLKRYGSLEYVRARAQDFVTDSVGALGTLKENDARDALIETVKFMAGRVV
ncbi:MAG: polyprenyl synthetase family protein [Planctomycetes bacterium]|nr:polyprenyl synthetase family protein [Planctomycetota bacterium]